MPRSAPRRVNHIAIGKLVSALQQYPMTVEDAAEASGLSVSTVRRVMISLHKEGASRIVGWEADSMGRYVTQVYILQRGKDAKRPKPARARERSRRAARDIEAQLAIQNAIAGVAR